MIAFLTLLALLHAVDASTDPTCPAAVASVDDEGYGGAPDRVDHRLYPIPASASPVHEAASNNLPPESTGSSRLTHGIVGGLIGAAAGVAVCTLISNAFFNEGSGFSTCTTKGNLMFAGGGLAVGFTIGWLTGHDP